MRKINNIEKKFMKFEPKLSADRKVILIFCRAPEGTWIELVQEI